MAGRLARTGLTAMLVAAAGSGLILGSDAAASARPHASADLDFQLIWTESYTSDHQPFAFSSPVVAELPKGPAVVAGDRSGHVYAVYLTPGSRGGPITAWEVTTRGPDGPVGVDSSPSSYDGVVYFGIGWAGTHGVGGYEAINPNGSRKWFEYAKNPSSDPTPDAGVAAGLSVSSLQSQTSVVGPSLGQNTYLFNAASGARLEGFPWFQADTDYSTAAVADVEGNGQNQIVMGGNTTAGTVFDTSYINGGQIRILSETGNGGSTSRPNGGLYCEYTVDQGVDSSPAVGDIFGGKPGIVVGTGDERAGESDTDDLFAINPACHLVWKKTLDGATISSPALADVEGNGQLQALEGTNDGWVYALNAGNGSLYWQTHVPGEVIGGVVTANLGNGYQDVIVPSTSGAYVLDGKSGAIVKTIEASVGLQNSPLVTEDPNGTIGLTIAGYSGGASTQHAVMEHFEVVGSNGSDVNEAGAWPEFHHDPQLSGDANVPVADNLKIETTALPAGVVGVSYRTTLTAADGTSPYVWSRTGGTKPPGLFFSSTGAWNGTPSASGTYTFPIQVGDQKATRVVKELKITIKR